MHLSYWRGELEEVESAVRRLIRGYEGIPTEVPRCVLQAPTAYYGEGMPAAGEEYRVHTVGALNRMCRRPVGVGAPVVLLRNHAVAEVHREDNMCPQFVWYRTWQLTAGKRERLWRLLQALLPGEEHMLATNRKCGRRGPILVLGTDFGGAEQVGNRKGASRARTGYGSNQ